MKHRATITRQTEDGLYQRVWEFYYLSSFNDGKVVLDKYGEYKRKTRRHRWQVVKLYNRLSSRNWAGPTKLTEEPAIPQSVFDAALQEFRTSLVMAVTVERDCDG